MSLKKPTTAEVHHHFKVDETPLCVDLDHTLIQTDLLVESTILLIKQKPLHILLVPFLFLIYGKAKYKSYVAQNIKFNPASLPYHKDVFFFLKRMVSRGRKLYLVTGSNEKLANSVAEFLGFFSGVFASSETVNLIGDAKATLLTERFGEKNFDYIGDSYSDLKVWSKARSAYVVANSPSFLKLVQTRAKVEKIFNRRSGKIAAAVKSLRIHQWAKNALVVIPMLLSGQPLTPSFFYEIILGFFSFSFAASAIYIINDLSDLDADRLHPDKKHRPFAAGTLPVSAAFILVPVMALGSILLASQLSEHFTLILFAYALMTNLYTFFLKRIPMADVIVLAGLYCMRLVAGSALTQTLISPWLLAFSGCLFVSLALIKRCSELIMLRDSGNYKAVGRGYHVVDLPILFAFGCTSAYASVLVMALYINSDSARLHYPSHHFLWLICPLLLYWISRTWFLTNRGKIHSDPVKFALTDHISWSMLISVAAIIYLAHH